MDAHPNIPPCITDLDVSLDVQQLGRNETLGALVAREGGGGAEELADMCWPPTPPAHVHGHQWQE